MIEVYYVKYKGDVSSFSKKEVILGIGTTTSQFPNVLFKSNTFPSLNGIAFSTLKSLPTYPVSKGWNLLSSN